MCSGWVWRPSPGRRMINKVASTFQVDRRVQCMANCSVSLVCDSYNYRDAEKTCQFNTHLSLVSSTLTCHWSVTRTTTVTPTRRASSTLTTLRSSPTRLTLSTIAPGAGSAAPSPCSSELTSFLHYCNAEVALSVAIYSGVVIARVIFHFPASLRLP